MMKILFTGASSFTGYWFVKALSAHGHEVFATLTKNSLGDYDDIRAERVGKLSKICTLVFTCPFGSDSFMELMFDHQNWDLLCHHAADVKNYRSMDFDIGRALAANTNNIQKTLEALVAGDCRKVVLTGSVFEQDEGTGEKPLHAFSPYGLSKGLTADVFRYWCNLMEMKLGKFVIPNPFGPFEEPRFTAYLARRWFEGDVASVRTPLYIRDNIHVSLLAESYRQFVESLHDSAGFQKINPSGYVESQGTFAIRFANEMRKRFDLPCELELVDQTYFEEPRMRINTDPVDAAQLGWSEKNAWDEMALFYLSKKNTLK